jgi:hypothetical protein
VRNLLTKLNLPFAIALIAFVSGDIAFVLRWVGPIESTQCARLLGSAFFESVALMGLIAFWPALIWWVCRGAREATR